MAVRAFLLMIVTGLAVLVAPHHVAAAAERTETALPSIGDDIAASYVRLRAPLPDGTTRHPKECDHLGYLRFRHVNGPAEASRADAVLTAQPGATAGASSLDRIARNVVHKASLKGRYAEFWALDRRGNCVEDRTGIEAAHQAGDYRRAFDYYYGDATIGGRRFAGFKTDAELPYVAEFGLATAVRDWREVLVRELPDQRTREAKVFCGGHSMGGLVTAALAAWDFDGDPKTTADAGYRNCAGFFALDTLITTDPLGLRTDPVLRAVAGMIAGRTYTEAARLVRSGGLPRTLSLLPGINPEVMTVLRTIGLAAHLEGDRPTELTRLIPRSGNWDLTMRLLFSRRIDEFVSGRPSLRDFRLTNAAMLGAFMDDNSAPLAPIQASFGTFDGGPVAEKKFPVPREVGRIPFIGPLITSVAGNGALMIPADTAKVYRWRNYDRLAEPDAPRQVNDDGEPFTSPGKEVTEIGDFARTVGAVPLNFTEEYFPTRVAIDTAFMLAGARDGDLRGVVHEKALQRRPILTILGGDGVISALRPFIPEDAVILPGYQHLDVLTAAARQNNGRPEGSSEALTNFVTR